MTMASSKKLVEMDSRWSWVIAFSCCFINCLMYGTARLSGILMVATLETFQVSRASAALPFTVSTSVRNLSGIFVGYLGQRFGLRAIIATGSILASVGAGLCFFVSDITWTVVCWGGIFGLGFGLSTCLLPLAINQHFDRYRGTASGISYSGSYIGSFLFPPLVVLLLDKYGLSGMFIVISAMFLNGLTVSMLFHSPSTISETYQQDKRIVFRESYSNKDNQYSEVYANSSRLKKMWLQLWHKIKSKCNILKFKEEQTILPEGSVYFIDSNLFNDIETTKNGSSYCQLVSYSDFSSKQISLYDSYDLLLNFASHEKKLPLKDTNFYTRISKRTRFKRKMTKIKKYFIRERYSFGKRFSNFQFENVKLTSFKHFSSTIPTIKERSRRNSFCTRHKTKYISSSRLFSKISRNYGDHTIYNSLQERTSTYTIVPELINCRTELPKDSIQKHNEISVLDSEFHSKREIENINGESYQHCSSSLQSSHNTKLIMQFNNNKQEGTQRANECFGMSQCSLLKNSFKCLFGWFRLYAEPMFVVIAITMSLHTFVIVCMITIIEDFAKDIGIPESQVHYVLMVLSAADLFGSLTLGMITDRGFLSRTSFVMLCFFGMAICQVSISYARSFVALLSLVVIYGIFESGIIITFPLLIDLFVPQKKQAVAVASSNILSSPSVLLVPLVIGYFRDRKGCYSGVFYCLGITSLSCCFIWFIAPYVFAKSISKPKNLKEK